MGTYRPTENKSEEVVVYPIKNGFIVEYKENDVKVKEFISDSESLQEFFQYYYTYEGERYGNV
jgi:hypothetical protein